MTYVVGVPPALESMGFRAQLWCDGWLCTSRGEGQGAVLYGENAVALRLRARSLGWRKLGGPGGLGDRCPLCQPASRRRS